MSDQERSTTMYCWPKPWLEAAMGAGFAHYKGGGEWEFHSDKMRDMLAEFGNSLVAAEREHCARLCETRSMHAKTIGRQLEAADCANAIRSA